MHQTGHFRGTLKLYISGAEVKHSLPHIKEHIITPRMTSDLNRPAQVCSGTNIGLSLCRQIKAAPLFVDQSKNIYIYSDQERIQRSLEKDCYLDLQFWFVL